MISYKKFNLAALDFDPRPLDIETTIDFTAFDMFDFTPALSFNSGSATASGTGSASASFYGFASGSGSVSISASAFSAVGADGRSYSSVSASASGDTVFGTGSAQAGTSVDSFTFSSTDLSDWDAFSF